MAAEPSVDRAAPCTLSFLILKVNERIHLIVAYRKQLFDFSTIEELAALTARDFRGDGTRA